MSESTPNSGQQSGQAPRVRVINLGSERMSAVLDAARGQPNMAVRAAILTFLVFIAIPIFLLLLLAGLAAVVVFSILSLVNWILARLTTRGVSRGAGKAAANEGRRNVRVINRD